jgi:hypothetical protein
VPFVRFSRDKRGYEYVFLVDVPSKQANSRARVLYWYRTPPGMKVGRAPFDEAVRQALEGHYPDLEFDWKQIVETPMPPPELTTNWRERRRTERAAKRARLQDELEEAHAESAATEADSRIHESESRSAQPGPQVPDEGGAGTRPAGRRRRRRGRGRRPDTAALQTSGEAVASAEPVAVDREETPAESTDATGAITSDDRSTDQDS